MNYELSLDFRHLVSHSQQLHSDSHQIHLVKSADVGMEGEWTSRLKHFALQCVYTHLSTVIDKFG